MKNSIRTLPALLAGALLLGAAPANCGGTKPEDVIVLRCRVYDQWIEAEVLPIGSDGARERDLIGEGVLVGEHCSLKTGAPTFVGER